MKVLVTGSDGFIAKNLCQHLSQDPNIEILPFSRSHDLDYLKTSLLSADFIFHLAGVNRPSHESHFSTDNVDLTQIIVDTLSSNSLSTPLTFSSSIHASHDTPYGISKSRAEQLLLSLQSTNPIFIYRLPGIFGKWSRPFYNSVVSTFCYQLCNDQPVSISNPASEVDLLYIDDLVESFILTLKTFSSIQDVYISVSPTYTVSLATLHTTLLNLKELRHTLDITNIGSGLTKKLYSTLISYFKPEQFSYSLSTHSDPRGIFVEVLKSSNSGQISFFTAHPGVSRGCHYHHTKTEKFVVVSGTAKFTFRSIITSETAFLTVDATNPQVVDSVPGWVHEVTNVGQGELVVLVWSNETFDPSRPDTFVSPF